MAWGYEASFTIEHDNTLKRKIDCKDCYFYEQTDKSCLKRPLYLPEDGYHSWRNCKYFALNPEVSNYEEKKKQDADAHERVKKLVAKKQRHPFGAPKSEFPQDNVSREGVRNSHFVHII